MKFYYTQIPNLLLDEIMASLTGSEFKVLICICRKTYGFQKKEDAISTSQISGLTGISDRHIPDVVKKLEDKKLINVRRNGTRTSVYSINESILPSEISSEEGDQLLLKKVQKTTEQTSQETTETSEISSHTKEREKEKIKKPSPPTTPVFFPEDSREIMLSQFFHNELKRNNKDMKIPEPDWQLWAQNFQKIIDSFGPSDNLIKSVIVWAIEHKFWSPHIRDPYKLNQKFFELKNQMQNDEKFYTSTPRSKASNFGLEQA